MKSPNEGLSFATPDELAARLFGAVLGTMDLASVYLGDRMGYYQLLHEGGPANSPQLAARAGTDERYTREWLEQQAATGILACANPEAAPKERLFALPDGYESVLLDPNSLNAMAPAARITLGALKPLAALLDAFRTGAGIPFEDYGADLAEGQAGMTRPLFIHQLTQEWIPGLPDIHERFLNDPPARIADIGMGLGLSSIELARGYPKIRVDGFDLDEASVVAANANLPGSGVEDRVSFHYRDAGDPTLEGQYDFAIAIECVHDMSNPVAVLSAMRRLVGPGGTALVVDERAGESFTPMADDMERMFYGFSILHCLPVGRVETPSVETGTVMRPDTFRSYAAQAGFVSTEILPIENDFFRFYRLTA